MEKLKTFFQEKELEPAEWELTDDEGKFHIISNEVVIEEILAAPETDQRAIYKIILKIDYNDSDINDYLRHLGIAMVAGFLKFKGGQKIC